MNGSEVEELRAAVRAAFAEASPSSEVRAQMATARGWDPAVWGRLCGELGVSGLAVDEASGGSGLGYAELAMVFEEAGRVLLCAPLLSVAGLAIPLLAALADARVSERLLPGLLDGTSIVAVVTADGDGRDVADHPGVVAEGDQLSGRGGFVIDGAHADAMLVPARGADGLGVFVVDPGTPGVTITSLITLDQTRKQARLDLDGVPAQRVGSGDASPAVARALDVARAMLASEQVGVAQHSLDMTVAYAKQRVQFGRPIGSFQALKQELAELLILVESARSAAYAAAEAAASDADDLSLIAAVAAAYCSEAASVTTAQAIQLHGGIGFTWEHDAHLYFKRARASEEMLGTPRAHYEKVAELI
ncbi:MAG TPA: acyl-CoA dehydrogenase family protein [Mycobacteriales bacterium]|nr:acyl-CoA dehydrogenase family protein [Mycobacteriales bacterium]